MQHPHQSMIDPRESLELKSELTGHEVQPGQGQESLGRVTISGPAMVNVSICKKISIHCSDIFK